jgi:hypothetical protein
MMPTGHYSRPSLMQRFDSKWQRSETTDCWLWTGRRVRRHGSISTWRGQTENAHRIAWMLHHGDPGALHVLHRCDEPLCVNPYHLFLGTACNYSKLTEANAAEIRRRYNAGKRPLDLARDYGVTPTLIVQIGKRKVWRHVP